MEKSAGMNNSIKSKRDRTLTSLTKAPVLLVLIPLLLFLFPGKAFSQDSAGMLKGVVSRASDNSSIGAATVKIESPSNPDIVLATGLDGKFSSPVDPGELIVEISAQGFLTQRLPVTIVAGEEQDLPVILPEDSDESTIEVRGRLLEASARKQLLERRFATEVSDRVGAEEISKSGSSDAGEVVSRLPAVTIVGGKFAYVRGLGGRYSQTLLDGTSIPSPEPAKKVVPLDLFPSSIIESVVVSKSYSPELPGEFAGGSVRISTVGVPEGSFTKFSLGSSYNTQTTFRDFNTYKGGNYDFLGFDDGTRGLPDGFPSVRIAIGNLGIEGVQAVGRSFDNNWALMTSTAMPGFGFDFSFGDKVELDGLSRFGYVGSFSYSNSYQNIEDRRKVDFGVSGEDLVLFNDYTIDSSSFGVDLTGIFSMTYEHTPAQKITLRNMLSRSTSDSVNLTEGVNVDNGEPIRFTQFRYIERAIFNSQLTGEHLLVGDSLLNWKTSFSYTERDEPDTRSNKYELSALQVDTDSDGVPDTLVEKYRWYDKSFSGSRDFYFLDEHVFDSTAQISIPFSPFAMKDPNADPLALLPSQYLKFGLGASFRDRGFSARLFRYRRAGTNDVNGVPIDFSLPPELLFTEDNIHPTGFVLEEFTRSTDNYEAEQQLYSGFASTSFLLSDQFRIQGGLRIESSNQEVRTFELFGNGEIKAINKTTDPLPAINLTYELEEDHQLRFGVSQTVSRPQLRELSEAQYTDTLGSFSVQGNPDLETATLQNFDVRYESYPTPDEIFSVGIFYKNLDKPIEQVQLQAASALIKSFLNAKDGTLFGIEVEARTDLSRVHPVFDGFLLSANLAFIDSEVTAVVTPLLAQTNLKRPLQGQPEYVANLGIYWEDSELGLESSLQFNTFGERISSVGANGLQDEYEQPRLDLDWVISKKFEMGKLKFKVTNLLNEDYKFQVNDAVAESYRKGVGCSLSYSVDF